MTETDLINYGIMLGAEISDGQALADIVSDDLASEEKERMSEGVNYYKGYHDILRRKIEYTIDGETKEDETKANNKVVNAFHAVLVDQKVGYILSNPIQFSTDNEKFQEVLNNELGDWFTDICSQWIEGASNKGIEWLHPYIDDNGKLEYIIFPAEQIIPVYEARYNNRLLGFFRHYDVTETLDGIEATTTHLEYYDDKQVTFFTKINGTFFKDASTEEAPNPRGHFYYNKGGVKRYRGWGKPPIIGLGNNTHLQTDLEKVKPLIDVYDLAESDFANNLEDIQDVIYNLKGYSGTNLSEFMKDLKVFKAIKTDENGGVEVIDFEIPSEAREKFLTLCEKNIYIFGMGFNPADQEFASNSSGVALKYKYSLLDLKSNKLINKLKSALKEFMFFLTAYINERDKSKFNYESVSFTIQKSMLVNEAEKIDSAQKSKGIISDKTIAENHPWVKDIEKEMAQLEEQNSVNLDNVNLDDMEQNADQMMQNAKQ